jgi:hypothetical protein
LLVAFSFFASVAEAAPRRRAVRSPGQQCTYVVSVGFAADAVSDQGLSRGVVSVTSIGTSCAGWAVDSPVDWIQVETDGAAAYVTVSPNFNNVPRSALIRVAGTRLLITQQISVVVSPPVAGLLQNGTFPLDLSHWGWQDRFPNGTGDVSWSSIDANQGIASGSMRLRDDTSSGNAYQQMQCVNTQPGVYDYGFAVRSASRDGAQGVMAFVNFEGENCTGNYPAYAARTVKVAAANVWERHEYVGVLAPEYKSIGLIVAGWARQPGVQEVWVDDVFLRAR